MKKINVLAFTAVIAIILSGCKGSTGPEGPAGPAGKNGVSNINIQVYTVDKSAWAFDTDDNFWEVDDADGAITGPTNEAVSVSFSDSIMGGSANGQWQGLPATNVLSSNDELTFAWSTNAISFFYKNASAPNQTMYFNVAVIPSSVMKRHPGMNWKDSKAVFALPEMQAAIRAKNLNPAMRSN